VGAGTTKSLFLLPLYGENKPDLFLVKSVHGIGEEASEMDVGHMTGAWEVTLESQVLECFHWF
jgi:hypothetical protein